MKITSNKIDFQKEFSDCFVELGTLKIIHHITIDKNIDPVIHSTRRKPIALQEKLSTTLDDMIKCGIIEPITELTDWMVN